MKTKIEIKDVNDKILFTHESEENSFINKQEAVEY